MSFRQSLDDFARLIDRDARHVLLLLDDAQPGFDVKGFHALVLQLAQRIFEIEFFTVSCLVFMMLLTAVYERFSFCI